MPDFSFLYPAPATVVFDKERSGMACHAVIAMHWVLMKYFERQ